MPGGTLSPGIGGIPLAERSYDENYQQCDQPRQCPRHRQDRVYLIVARKVGTRIAAHRRNTNSRGFETATYFEKVTFIPATFARAIRTDGELRSGCLSSPDERQSQ